jgi:hypothetical protein
MASVEERLARIERELEVIKADKQELTFKNGWAFRVDQKYKGDPELKEIFRLGKELRDAERTEEQE